MPKIFLLIALALMMTCFSYAAPQACRSNYAYEGPDLREPISPDQIPEVTIDFTRSVSANLANRLETLFTQLVEDQTNASRASIAIWSDADGFWSLDYGAKKSAEESTYWWASVGKLVTASIILQLADEDALSLDDSISNWFEGYPNAELTTINHLLTHTGGVFSFNSDKKLHQQRGYKSAELLIDVSARHGSDFCPGTNWSYSNTGYVMLSRIAERVAGEPFAKLVQSRIAEPLSLASLGVIAANDPSEIIVSPGGEDPPTIAGIASIYGAGAIKADAADMLRLLAAYLRGDVVAKEQRRLAFSDLYPMFGSTMHYGRGVMVTDVPDPERPTVWLGHSGGSPNAKSLVIYDAKRAVFIAIVLNHQAPAEAIANAVLKELDSLH